MAERSKSVGESQGQTNFSTNSAGRWLVSPAFDLGFFILPGLVSAALAFGAGGAETPPWVWVVLVVGIDVAHVWSTLFRTWLSPEDHGRLPAGLAFGALAGCVLLYAALPQHFWRVLAYLAVWHFVRQQVGFTALYQRRAGVVGWEARLERWTCAALCLLPLVWWHTHLPRRFWWFEAGDFVALPAWVFPPTLVVGTLVGAAWLALRLRSGRAPGGGDLWLLTTAACWVGGIVLTNGDLAFTLTNVVLHGVAYFALVGRTLRGRDGRLALLPLLLVPVALAAAEEGLWAWFEHAGLAVPLLAVPQVTHYLLDGFIWKPSRSPALGRWLGL